MKSKQEQIVSYEVAMEELKSIVSVLESGALSLEESVEIYERGAFLVKQCGKYLENCENRVTKLSIQADGSAEEIPFEETTGA